MYQKVLLSQMRLVAAATGVALAFGVVAAHAADPKAITKCKRTIAKNAASFEAAKLKSLQKCEDGILKGKIVSCPDSKATDNIGKALTKLTDKIGKACDGADPRRDGLLRPRHPVQRRAQRRLSLLGAR